MTDPKMRRRYIYMRDEDWETIRATADAASITMSEVIRRQFGPLAISVGADSVTIDPPPAKGQPVIIGFNPAPKPVRKKR